MRVDLTLLCQRLHKPSIIKLHVRHTQNSFYIHTIIQIYPHTLQAV